MSTPITPHVDTTPDVDQVLHSVDAAQVTGPINPDKTAGAQTHTPDAQQGKRPEME